MTCWLLEPVAVTLVPSRISSPCFCSVFIASLASCLSTVGRNSSIASRITTSEPRRRQTLPSSKPITPAPMIPSVRGAWLNSSAPVESKMRSLSTAATGIVAGTDPVAMIICLPTMTCVSDASSVTGLISTCLSLSRRP